MAHSRRAASSSRPYPAQLLDQGPSHAAMVALGWRFHLLQKSPVPPLTFCATYAAGCISLAGLFRAIGRVS